ncbi:hypothetical protein F2Q68_00012110 [Brassica cretica]|uniref:Uncharacterized protein n=1 Tax=Brassica cretica TaxID=69181 RepID=A0A8S9KYS5_BRACR|nr:hypothetical protein F2Q68_00012110 [Brassica cretica]
MTLPSVSTHKLASNFTVNTPYASTSAVSSLLYHLGQENFTGDRDGWEKSLRGLLEGLKGRESVTGRRMKNSVVGERARHRFRHCTVWSSARRIYRNSCMVAYTPWRFYDPVDTTIEPSSGPATPTGNETRSVAQDMSFVMNLSSRI